MSQIYWDQKIRKIPNFPKKGILFYDVSTLFEDAEAFKKLTEDLCEPYKGQKIDKVVGVEARGFLMAASMAYILGAGVSIARKKGKLPHKTVSATYEKEYGPDELEMHEDTIKPGEKVIIADDLLATGGTIIAVVDLVEKLGGDIFGIDFVVNLSFLPGYELLKKKGYSANYLIDYDNEKI